jgi:hypothetical protein
MFAVPGHLFRRFPGREPRIVVVAAVRGGLNAKVVVRAGRGDNGMVCFIRVCAGVWFLNGPVEAAA